MNMIKILAFKNKPPASVELMPRDYASVQQTKPVKLRRHITQITQIMQVPLSYAEDIIAIDGTNITHIRRSSGAALTVQESHGRDDVITVEIKGTAMQVQTAHQQLIQVNQKMMKSALIKDLYCEIEKLKAEVYATREKNGVYIPKERYYQEESERKAMADQIEQMGVTIESQQKQLEELQGRYVAQVQECSDFSRRLDSTQKDLRLTRKLLAGTEEELKRCKYTV